MQRKQHPHLLFLIDLVYYVLFVPLLFIPVAGWGVLIALSDYRERLEYDQ
jgi:hypothetical protein